MCKSELLNGVEPQINGIYICGEARSVEMERYRGASHRFYRIAKGMHRVKARYQKKKVPAKRLLVIGREVGEEVGGLVQMPTSISATPNVYVIQSILTFVVTVLPCLSAIRRPQAYIPPDPARQTSIASLGNPTPCARGDLLPHHFFGWTITRC